MLCGHWFSNLIQLNDLEIFTQLVEQVKLGAVCVFQVCYGIDLLLIPFNLLAHVGDSR